MRIFIRWMSLLGILMTGLIFATIMLSPIIPNRVGTISINGWDSNTDETGRIFVDMDTGLRAIETFESTFPHLSIPGLRFIVLSESEDGFYYIAEVGRDALDLNYFDGSETTLIHHYEDIEAINFFWHIRDESLLLVEANDEAGVILHSIDVETWDISPFMTFPEFRSASFLPSMDGHYLVMRGQSGSAPATLNQSYLIDTQTGSFTDLGVLAFVYWSPVGHHIAIGYESETDSELDVSIYDVENHSLLETGIRILVRDAVQYYDGFSSTGILWSEDAQVLAVLNRSDERIYSVSVSGEILWVDADRLTPKLWSPDNQYLLTIGRNAEDESGAFVIDFQEGVVAPIESERPITDLSIDVSWSPDSNRIALINYSVVQSSNVQVTVYDMNGHLIRESNTLLPSGFRVYFIDIEWANED